MENVPFFFSVRFVEVCFLSTPTTASGNLRILMLKLRCSALLSAWLVLAIASHPLPAQSAGEPASAARAMEMGAFLFFLVDVRDPAQSEASRIIPKALAIRCGTNGGVCFDTDLLRYAAVWQGGFLDLSKTSLMQSAQGSHPATIHGRSLFRGSMTAGISTNGVFSDSRASPRGPLPRPLGLFKGIHRHGDQTIIHYRVAQAEVFELPEMDSSTGAFRRHLLIKGSGQAIHLSILGG